MILPVTRVERLVTDGAGPFRFPAPGAGQYVLSARKEGYAPLLPPGIGAAPSSSGSARLTTDRPNADLRFTLSTRITGLVIDDETGQPAANTRIVVTPYFERERTGSRAERAGAHGRRWARSLTLSLSDPGR